MSEQNREVSVKAKLAFRDFNPKQIGAADEATRSVELGEIWGSAIGTISATDESTGEVRYGLRGSFKIIPVDPKKAILRSSKLWCPDLLLDPVLEQLAAIGDAKELQGAAVQFGYKVYVDRANNPAGYEWRIAPLNAATANDPLDHFIAQSKAPALEHKLAATAAPAEPVPATSKKAKAA